MPIPDDHLRRLDRCLAGHERALARIREGEGSEEDALVHETILTIGRDPYVLWALDELWDHPSMATRCDAPTYFRRAGIPLPLDADVRFEAVGRHIRVQATFEHGPHRYVVSWDRAAGFSMERDPTPRRTR